MSARERRKQRKGGASEDGAEKPEPEPQREAVAKPEVDVDKYGRPIKSGNVSAR
jgi:hypothetical protein